MLQLKGLKSGPKSLRSPNLEGYETGAELYIYVRDTVTYGRHLDSVTWGVSYQSMLYQLYPYRQGSYKTRNYTLRGIKCQHLWQYRVKVEGIQP